MGNEQCNNFMPERKLVRKYNKKKTTCRQWDPNPWPLNVAYSAVRPELWWWLCNLLYLKSIYVACPLTLRESSPEPPLSVVTDTQCSVLPQVSDEMWSNSEDGIWKKPSCYLWRFSSAFLGLDGCWLPSHVYHNLLLIPLLYLLHIMWCCLTPCKSALHQTCLLI